ncbi:MAG: hypothetical protein H7336_15495 [Bacteriovorax sp.]|nr:hypothetical protein [Bacteriovorax sp.]
MRLAVIFVLALSIQILFANDQKSAPEQSFAEKMRPKMMKILGEVWTVKLIGADKSVKTDEVPMPVLPKVIDDAKSTAVYDKKQDKVSIKPEVEQKYNYAFIREIFEATRQTKPNDDEIGKLMNVLSQGGSREGVYRSLVLDSVYAGMENWDKPVKKNSADFAVYFYNKYLGKTIVIKSLEGMNLFTLKRLVTEKALDMTDAFGDEHRGDLEKWYANMSADMATKFPSVWTNVTRKNASATYHKMWASKVPVQHVKSEIIIKLHSAFNSML